jgi:hypothetical protein
MINHIVFIIWCLVILAIVVFSFLVFKSRHDYNIAVNSNDVWCYGDLLCGKGSERSSPVLDTLPITAACRLENFTTEGNRTCVCPIRYIFDWDLNKTTGKIEARTSGIRETYSICDNYAMLEQTTSTPVQPTAGIQACSQATCQALWQNPLFHNEISTLPNVAWTIRNSGKAPVTRVSPRDYNFLGVYIPTYRSSQLYNPVEDKE